MSAPNLCTNPFLATDASGWGSLGPVAGSRLPSYSPMGPTPPPGESVPPAVDPGPRFAWVQHNNAAAAGAYLPRCPVVAGREYAFMAASTIHQVTAAGLNRHRVEVDWYGPSNTFLSHTDGPWAETDPFGYGNAYLAVGRFTAPAGAVRANVLVRINAVRADNSWAVRAANYVDLTTYPDYGVPPNGLYYPGYWEYIPYVPPSPED